MFFNIVHAATLPIILVLIGVSACASSEPPPQGPPAPGKTVRFSSILNATPTTRNAGLLHARFLLDDEFRVVGAKLTFDSEGRTSTTRFWDWKGGCPL